MVRASTVAACVLWLLFMGCESSSAGGDASAGRMGGDGGVPASDEGDAGVPNSEAEAQGVFESDLPEYIGVEGSADGGLAEEVAPPDPGDDVARAIEEADVIQVGGDRLYALSRAAGLSVIDVSNPDALRLLGRYRELAAEPLEMYLRDSVVIAMFSGWGEYVEDAVDGWRWVETSKVVALDATDPAEITALGSFEVPGEISDSRIVGDVLYVVGYQNGYCWRCPQNQARTAVLSLDVSEPRAMTQVDELDFADGNNQWGWSRRSVAVTEQRMYVAGPEYGIDSPQGSTIQVIDISDPAGDLVMGASVDVAGQITSRWQMDEYQGVLRVISQPPQWNTEEPPHVQTFTVASSHDLTPLASMDLVLPRPEQLQSVRFDGQRGYAITFERTDPLFTIDLSDPANPMQRGELEMPGFVYHMVPRGDRLLGLGFDQGNPAGSITVSLFDVSDLSAPSMIDRVNFGGDWAALPEDQNRIHKAFKVLDGAGLLLVPFRGWDWDAAIPQCGSTYEGGVQLVDFVGDTLTLRGKAPVDGSVRRAVLLGERLLTVSDERAQTFDITDRDLPSLSSGIVLARNVASAHQLENGSVARVTLDWWSGEPKVDFVAVDQADDPNASLGSLNLRGVLDSDLCSTSVWPREAFVHGNRIEILYEADEFDESGTGVTRFHGLVIIDGSDPTQPNTLSNTRWPADRWRLANSYFDYGYYGEQKSVARTDDAIVALETRYNQVGEFEYGLRVIDVRDPSAPRVTVHHFPDSRTYSGLVTDGDAVWTGHFETADASPGKARFYADRFDLSNLDQIVPDEPVNVPGALVHVDAVSGDLLTSELVRTEVEVEASAECYENLAPAQYTADDESAWGGPGHCEGYFQRLNLVAIDHGVATREDALRLDGRVDELAGGDGVVFTWTVFHDDSNPGSWDGQVVTLGGFGTDELQHGRLTVDASRERPGLWRPVGLYASGRRAVLASYEEVAVVDASNAAHPTLVRTEPIYGPASSVQITDEGKVLLGLGLQGLQWFDL